MDILIENNFEGKLIREVLFNDLKFSVNFIKKLKFSPDGIKVNGEWVTVRYQLKRGDILSLATEDKPEDVSPYIIPVDLKLDVIYEDDYVTAINKPYNMPSHPSLGHKLDTVANALAYRYSDRTYVFRPVNRLDRDTSGCMLTANTKDSSYKMYTSMVEGKIKKSYIAIIDGIMPEREGVLRSFMHRRSTSIIEREECSADAPDAKPAITLYKTLTDNGQQSLVLASPLTGRTHQIRIHFASRGCPVTGDTMYGSASPYIDRHALHSWKTVFPHPMTDENVEVVSQIPEDIQYLADCLKLDLSVCGKDIV